MKKLILGFLLVTGTLQANIVLAQYKIPQSSPPPPPPAPKVSEPQVKDPNEPVSDPNVQEPNKPAYNPDTVQTHDDCVACGQG